LKMVNPVSFPDFENSHIQNQGLEFDSRYEPKLVIDYYSDGNIQEVKKTDDYSTTYLWGYNYSYPVAKIENATFTEVKAALGGTIPDLGTGGLNDAQINSLRTNLPKALITIYTYTPLVGITIQTDPNGIKTKYEYDSLGRLKLIKDDDDMILKTYDYHYKQ